MITHAQIAALFPRARPADRAVLVDNPEVLHEAGLFDPGRRLHVFLAQIGHESAGLTRRVESLRYSRPKTLMRVWPQRFPTMASATPFVARPEALAEKVYGGRRDLGNTRPGDGARFIGRGWLQVTGRANYRILGRIVGVDLEQDPEQAAEPLLALRLACAYWTLRGINRACDAGDFQAATRLINSAALHYEDRVAWLRRAQAAIPWPAGEAPPLRT